MCSGQCGVMQSTAHAGRVHLLQNACHNNVVTASSMHQAPKFVEHEPHWADFGVVYITNYQPIMHPPPQPTNWKSLLWKILARVSKPTPLCGTGSLCSASVPSANSTTLPSPFSPG